MEHRKIYWINVICAVFWLVLYASLMVNHFYLSESDSVTEAALMWLNLIHAFLVGLFSISAIAIVANSRKRLRSLAEAFNYSLILLVLIQFIAIFQGYSDNPSNFGENAIALIKFGIVFESIVFILPAILNINAFSHKDI